MPDGLLGSVEQFASTAASEEAAFGQLNELEEPLSNVRFVAITRQLLTLTLGSRIELYSSWVCMRARQH